MIGDKSFFFLLWKAFEIVQPCILMHCYPLRFSELQYKQIAKDVRCCKLDSLIH